MSEGKINLTALESLFAPDEEPNRHRTRAEKEGAPAKIVKGRRPSPIVIAQRLRSFVKEWREKDYAGASDTTRELLHHWFGREHYVESEGGERIPFCYFFCQREAIETLIYLLEVRSLTSLAGVVAEFMGSDAETAALGINPEEDRWAKYAFKLATGAGKTKVMSLAIVWSYFHALRESDSPMARHFVVVAPNLTVFERLREDFKPARGGKDIFDRDPLIPVAWKGDWNLTVVLQDEASGAATGGTLYLTNIHQLYDKTKRRKSEAETYEWVGPIVMRERALDTAEVLRERITGHQRVMVLNDESHHLWDPGSAWNESIAFLNDRIKARSGDGIVAQLDFSATPKDNSGRFFQHIVCDTPLGEAVDAGIVKTPIIGRGQKWVERANKDASKRFEEQLVVGYERWKKSKSEWKMSGKKPLLFVMTEDTEAADQIANRLNTDPVFKELNGKTANLHTNLKGKIKWVGGKKHGYPTFEESESEISDEDLKAIRELSRQLDSDKNPYSCIVSVLMLREGWDVRNVTTIVPLRPYSSPARILPEQTLGRGLRRMTPPTGELAVAEIVTVVEHPAFASLYREQLSQEGFDIEELPIDEIPKTTVSIYPDSSKKDFKSLEILLPRLSGGFLRTPRIEGLTIVDIKKSFSKYQPLKLGKARPEEIKYEGRHLFTNEVVERMNIKLALLQDPVGAIAFYRDELEYMTGLKGTHQVLAPLVESFLTEILFGEKIDLFEKRLLDRLADQDVREHLRATFVPLILQRTTQKVERLPEQEPIRVSQWKPFAATHSQARPALSADKTLFNLVPCNRELEVAMTQFLAKTASDVGAFCKNAGPQALRIDYLTGGSRLSFYTPDFLVRKADGHYVLVETKGRVDVDVPLKASAANSWCKAASNKKVSWGYLYVPEGVFEQFAGDTVAELQSVCAPHLADLLSERIDLQIMLPFGAASASAGDFTEFIAKTEFSELPPRFQKLVEQAINLFRFMEAKKEVTFAAAFTPLLGPIDDTARTIMVQFMSKDVPSDGDEQKKFFDPDMKALSDADKEKFKRQAANLRRTLIDQNGLMPIGLLRWCLDYAGKSSKPLGGVFEVVRSRFSDAAKKTDLYDVVQGINIFRNEYIAHQERELSDAALARKALGEWVKGLHQLWNVRKTI